MSAGDELKMAHAEIAKGNGQISVMLATKKITRAKLAECLSSIDKGTERLRALLGDGK